MSVDGADAADLLVAFRDVRFRLRRHAQAAKHVIEERVHVRGAFGSPERYDEQCVVVVVRRHGFACQTDLPTKNGPKLSRYCDVCSVLRISCTTADNGWSF